MFECSNLAATSALLPTASANWIWCLAFALDDVVPHFWRVLTEKGLRVHDFFQLHKASPFRDSYVLCFSMSWNISRNVSAKYILYNKYLGTFSYIT